MKTWRKFCESFSQSDTSKQALPVTAMMTKISHKNVTAEKFVDKSFNIEIEE